MPRHCCSTRCRTDQFQSCWDLSLEALTLPFLPFNVFVCCVARFVVFRPHRTHCTNASSYKRGWRGLSVCAGYSGEPCTTAEPIDMLFAKHARLGPRNRCAVHIGVTCRIRLNDACDAALRQITVTTCFAISLLVGGNRNITSLCTHRK